MAALFFHDACTVYSLALVDLLPRIKQIFGDKLRLAPTVMREVQYLLRDQQDLLSQVQEVFFTVDMPNPSELAQTQVFKSYFDTPGHDGNTDNLGEAETLAIIVCRYTPGETVLFVSDDKDAITLAQKQEEIRGTFGTSRLLELLEKNGLISSQEGADILAQLRAQGRHIL
ncbi:hypothetical protein [Varibaculum massiliense]|uniref:hypothetical protein n=1 Tax=Varibaculum massiliense TaxID=1852372 RepID=UPI0008D9CA4D|nr:hypothetical protein [Varibaculum massiliense]